MVFAARTESGRPEGAAKDPDGESGRGWESRPHQPKTGGSWPEAPSNWRRPERSVYFRMYTTGFIKTSIHFDLKSSLKVLERQV